MLRIYNFFIQKTTLISCTFIWKCKWTQVFVINKFLPNFSYIISTCLTHFWIIYFRIFHPLSIHSQFSARIIQRPDYSPANYLSPGILTPGQIAPGLSTLRSFRSNVVNAVIYSPLGHLNWGDLAVYYKNLLKKVPLFT